MKTTVLRMKTRNYLVMAAALAAFSSCSNNDEIEMPEVGGSVIPEMTISLTSPTTYADVSTDPGVGNESVLGNTLVFVKTTDGTVDAVASYKQISLTGGATQTTVKFPVNGSPVFVFSNLMGDYETAAKACITQEDLEGLSAKIEKSYMSGLTSKGSFIMSGQATIAAAGGTSAYSLPVTLNRDVAKVAFRVKKNSFDPKTGKDAKINTLVKVISIKVMRAANQVAPFNGTGFALPMGQNDLGYLEDDATDAKKESTGATDYSFIYTPTTVGEADAYTFNPFYVLPNYADRSSRGTIIVLEAMITETEEDKVGKVAFFKARISKTIDTFIPCGDKFPKD